MNNADVGVFAEAVAVNSQIGAVFFQTTYEFCAVFVIHVDNGVFQAVPVKQARLDGTIGFHRAVVVEVVSGEVGEDCAAEWHAVDARLVKAVAGDFHRGGCCALLTETVEQGLDIDGGGGGMRGFFQCAPKAVADRADNGGFFAQQIGGLRQPLCDGGFAVGTGYAPDFEAV